MYIYIYIYQISELGVILLWVPTVREESVHVSGEGGIKLK